MKLLIITGTCGAGKSTMKDDLATRLDPARYARDDSDETVEMIATFVTGLTESRRLRG